MVDTCLSLKLRVLSLLNFECETNLLKSLHSLDLLKLIADLSGHLGDADAISKLEEALEINSKRSEALWLFGNALMSLGLMTPAAEEAGSYFDEASGYLVRASEEDPGNQLYLKSLEVAAMAPQLHAQHRRQQAAAATEAGPSANNLTPSRTNKNSDLKYDIMGWAILAVGIVAFTVYAQHNMPPPPPQR